MHPRHCAFRAPARKVRSLGLCSADCTAMCKRRNRRDPSRRPCGHRGRCRRNAMGTQQQRAPARRSEKREAKGERRKAKGERRKAKGKGERERRKGKAKGKGERERRKGKAKGTGERRRKSNGTPDALLGRAGCASLWGPFTLRRQRTIRPVRGGAGPRRFRWVHGRTFSGTRPLTRTFRAGARKAQCEGVLLFGYFLLHKQEKVTRSPQASGSLGA